MERLTGSADTNLLDVVEAEARLLVTLDKDFRQLVLQRRAPFSNGGVLIIRVVPAEATPAESH